MEIPVFLAALKDFRQVFMGTGQQGSDYSNVTSVDPWIYFAC